MNESSQPTSFISMEEQAKGKEEKKIPMKPTPIKKKTTLDGTKEDNPLVIQSKEYQIKNNEEETGQQEEEYTGYRSVEKKVEERKESIEEKPKMRINRNRDKSNVKAKEEEEEAKETKQIPSEPFSIKKSGSVNIGLLIEKGARDRL